MAYTNETIVAISTPPGRSGIGIVRLSGSHARSIAEQVLRTRQPLAHASARFAEILENAEGTPRKLDEAVVTWFAAPHSYTGEDVIEIAAHGSPVVLAWLVRHALDSGARLARPGEFTERAFLSGRLDLTQAEAVHDLIEAQTLVQARTAAEQMGGALSRRIAPVKEELLRLIAILEAGVDFAEDDVDVLPSDHITARILSVAQLLAPIAASYTQGHLVHHGLRLAIVGPPNAGKSSLFNTLIEQDRAIVTPVPGTTRDLVVERVSIGGIPVELVDTAGLRETADAAEAIGIAKTRETIAEADLVLVVLDVTVTTSVPKDLSVYFSDDQPDRAILILNKSDLLSPASAARLIAAVNVADPHRPSLVSSVTRQGIPELRTRLLGIIGAANLGEQSGVLTNIRHQQAVSQAQAALSAAQSAVENAVPHEMLLLDLYASLEPLDRLTGTTTADDILNRIFSTFCIGK